MKIGIILDSINTSWYINDLVEWIKKNPVIIDPDLGRNGGIFFFF